MWRDFKTRPRLSRLFFEGLASRPLLCQILVPKSSTKLGHSRRATDKAMSLDPMAGKGRVGRWRESPTHGRVFYLNLSYHGCVGKKLLTNSRLRDVTKARSQTFYHPHARGRGDLQDFKTGRDLRPSHELITLVRDYLRHNLRRCRCRQPRTASRTAPNPNPAAPVTSTGASTTDSRRQPR